MEATPAVSLMLSTVLTIAVAQHASGVEVASGCWVSGFGFRVSGFGFRVPGFGFRVSGSGFQASRVGV